MIGLWEIIINDDDDAVIDSWQSLDAYYVPGMEGKLSPRITSFNQLSDPMVSLNDPYFSDTKMEDWREDPRPSMTWTLLFGQAIFNKHLLYFLYGSWLVFHNLK